MSTNAEISTRADEAAKRAKEFAETEAGLLDDGRYSPERVRIANLQIAAEQVEATAALVEALTLGTLGVYTGAV